MHRSADANAPSFSLACTAPCAALREIGRPVKEAGPARGSDERFAHPRDYVVRLTSRNDAGLPAKSAPATEA